MKNQYLQLFHGSGRIVENPLYGGGKPYNDYGPGFYCTENEDMAREWSVDAGRDGFVNRYELDTAELNILHLNRGSFTILHWLAILLENRQFQITSPLAREGKAYIIKQFGVPYRKADVIIGCRADDSYFAFAGDFINGAISVSQLEAAMHLGSLGEQVVLKSAGSYRHLKFLGYEAVDSDVWFSKKRKRDEEARRQYFQSDRMAWKRGELYITHILDEEIKADDERLQRIIC